MFRTMLIAVVILGLAVPAVAEWDLIGGDQDEAITISLTISEYVQVDWQDTEIHFVGDVLEPDFWSTQLRGLAYSLCPDSDGKYPMDAWAGDPWYGPIYYESFDGALIYINSNSNIWMTVTPSGDLDSGDDTIPLYFTMAGTLYGDGFLLGDTWCNDGNIPLDGPGSYAADEAPADGFIELGGTAFFPNQYPFPCAGSPIYTLNMDAQTQGTLKFLARIERNGLEDQPGTYTATLNVAFGNQ